MVVERTAVFPANRHEVFLLLQRFETLQEVASPYATFTPLDGGDGVVWTAGETAKFRLRLFGIFPFGTHSIHVIRFSETDGVFTQERNEHVPVWNHEIVLNERDGQSCLYTDRVEIEAGWRTFFIYLWACLFYAHRQRKWVRILRRMAG